MKAYNSFGEWDNYDDLNECPNCYYSLRNNPTHCPYCRAYLTKSTSNLSKWLEEQKQLSKRMVKHVLPKQYNRIDFEYPEGMISPKGNISDGWSDYKKQLITLPIPTLRSKREFLDTTAHETAHISDKVRTKQNEYKMNYGEYPDGHDKPNYPRYDYSRGFFGRPKAKFVNWLNSRNTIWIKEYFNFAGKLQNKYGQEIKIRFIEYKRILSKDYG